MTQKAMQLITFRVGGQEFGVDIMAVREIRTWAQPTPLPYALDHVRGVIDLRGDVLPIVDLSAKLGWSPVEATSNHVVIVLAVANQLQGFIVDSVCDIVDVPAGNLRPPPTGNWMSEASAVEGLVTHDARMITVLSLGHLELAGFEPALLDCVR